MLLARLLLRATLFVVLPLMLVPAAMADDWPTWRHDPSRTAVSQQKLPETLALRWSRQLAAPAPAWPEDLKMLFDAAYEPVVAGTTLVVGTNSDDSVLAFDTETGQQRWRFFADGPVRLAPVIASNKVYVGADDGAVYCLSLEDGKLNWKIPSPFGGQTVLGNDRLISLWPVRGGLVIDDDMLYYTAGVWPFEGAALFRVNLKEASSASAPPAVEVLYSFTDEAPQGYLAISEHTLFAPTGRGPAAGFSLQPDFTSLNNFGADKRSDCFLTLSKNCLFQGQRVIDFKARKPIPLECTRPVTAGNKVYAVQKDQIVATELSNPIQVKPQDPRGKPTERYGAIWHLPLQAIRTAVAADAKAQFDGVAVLDLLAGDMLVGHWGNVVFVVREPSGEQPPRVVWATVVEGTPATAIAADDKLFVSTREGRLLCFGKQGNAPAVEYRRALPTEQRPSSQSTIAGQLLTDATARDGYCVVWGLGDDNLVDALLDKSKLRIVVIDPDGNKIDSLRRRFADVGFYGTRLTARVGDATTIGLPPYLARRVVCLDPNRCKLLRVEDIAKKILPTIHPYGGAAYIRLLPAEHESLQRFITSHPDSGARVSREGEFTVLSRPDGLPGAADWTHEYADAGNSLMSQDKLVAAPLGILWYGGSAADTSFFYDRHAWPPSPLVVGGRMFLQGMNKLVAVDIYTGRVLWEMPIDHGFSPGRRVNFGTKNPDIGYHMAAANDAVYLCYPARCLRIDAATGKTLATFELPNKTDRWGEIHVIADRLLVPIFNMDKHSGQIPTRLVALDRITGKPQWEFTPDESCPLIASGHGRVYLYDGILDGLYRDMKRKGKVPHGSLNRYLIALDLQTGKTIWREPISIVATWITHSAETDALVACNQEGMQALDAATGKTLWNKSAAGVGFKGHPESRVDRLILWNDRIIDQRGPGLAYDLKTGTTITRVHPLTGEAVPWEFTSTSHYCSYAIACQNMLTYRDGTAAYCNVTDGMTTRLPGFRSGCRNSLIPAGGVLNAPNMAQGCNCGFSVFTSLALVHRPEVETWSYSPLKAPKGRVRRLGINLGAPADRLAPDGTLWLDWPSNNKPGYVLPGVAGPSPDVEVIMDAENPHWFRLPTNLMLGAGPEWVAATGVEGIRALTVPLGDSKAGPTNYTVRLVFTEPDGKKPGERVFDVAFNGRTVLKDFDLSKVSSQRNQIIVREFPDVPLADALRVDLRATAGRTLLCGVEIVAAPK